MVERIETSMADGALKSMAVVHNDMVFLSGVHATDTSGDIKEQTREVFKTIDRLLEAAGSNQRSIFVVHVWLKDMRYFGAMNSVWNEWADTAHPPARTCVSGELYRSDVLVEAVVIAYRA
ncbi:RidA family protein [Ensifer sp.]|uniref:RidA family protein n=1 Tax=Ensifer sp. TaxID=1872086 RepID=UPI00289CFDDF|nr:RidA family protein [Ensifer sp.]